MARRITTGKVGKNVLGDLSTTTNSIVSVVEDDDIILDPAGQGQISSEANIIVNDQKLLKLGDADSSNWVGFRAPATVAANVTLTFPATAGTSGYVLTTDGSGTLSWNNVAVQLADDVASDTDTYYPTLTSATSGGITNVKIVSGKLSFQPSSGTLSLGGSTGSSSTTTGTLVVTGGVGISQNCYVGGTMSANAIAETSSITYKENVSPITNALESILQLAGVTYDRKDGSSKNEAGLIAEETAKVLPNLVTYKNGVPEGINYTKLSAYLIEAVKELSSELKSLKGYDK